MIQDNQLSCDPYDSKLHDAFPMPNILANIITALNDPQVNSASLERILQHEPSFTLKLLTQANTTYYGSPGQVTTIHNAITLLGFNTLKSLVVHTSISDYFSTREQKHGFSSERLWKHSIGVAVCAKRIAQDLRLGQDEEFFIAGILHDLGLIVESRFFAGLFNIIWCYGQSTPSVSLLELEHDILGSDHAEWSERLCAAWAMPSSVQAMVRYHHDPLDAPAVECQAACVLAVADRVAQQRHYGLAVQENNEFPEEVLDVLGVDEQHLGIVVEGFEHDADDLMASYT